jgi:hypothetical protein
MNERNQCGLVFSVARLQPGWVVRFLRTAAAADADDARSVCSVAIPARFSRCYLLGIHLSHVEGLHGRLTLRHVLCTEDSHQRGHQSLVTKARKRVF